MKNFNKESFFIVKLYLKLKLIFGNLIYDEIILFILVSDIFVSLYRVEGLGRGGVEVILLGKNVVIIGYFGVEDYMMYFLVYFVSFDLVECKFNEYLFCEGESWVEFNIE